MFKTGSKFLLGLAAFGYVGAIVYAATTSSNAFGLDTVVGALTFGYKGQVGDHTGYAILMGLAAAALFLGVFLAATRDCDPEAVAQVAGLETVPEVVVPVAANYWPIVAAFSLASVALGLAFGPALFALGMVGLTICTMEWAASAWADRATGDPKVNADIRERLLGPIETPVGAVLGIAVIVLLVSRILLALPKIGAYLVFGIVPVIILGIGALIVLKPTLSKNLIAAIVIVGAVALLVSGVAAAIAGKHKTEEHKETGAGPALIISTPEGSMHVIRVGN